jgi:hypothetical protein
VLQQEVHQLPGHQDKRMCEHQGWTFLHPQ